MLALPFFEVRRDIPWYEEVYQISSFWNVVRIGFELWQNWGRRKPVKPSLNTKGYLIIRLSIKNKEKSFLLHRLLAFTFIPKVVGKNFINHKDWNKLNNSLNNLERCTESENIRHAKNTLWKRIGYDPKPIVWTNIISWDKVYFISLRASEEYGFKSSNISNCIKWKRLSHKWYMREVAK